MKMQDWVKDLAFDTLEWLLPAIVFGALAFLLVSLVGCSVSAGGWTLDVLQGTHLQLDLETDHNPGPATPHLSQVRWQNGERSRTSQLLRVGWPQGKEKPCPTSLDLPTVLAPNR